MLYASVSSLAIFLSCLFSATVLLFHTPKRPIHIVWSLLSYVIGLWSLGFCLTINAIKAEEALFWGRFHNYVAILIIPLFAHFVALLLEQHSRRIIFLYGFFGVYLGFNLLFFEKFIHAVQTLTPFHFYVQAGQFYWIFLALYCGFTSYWTAKLAFALPKSHAVKRKQIFYVLTAFLIGFIGGGTTFPLVFGIDFYPFGLGAIVIYVPLVTYTIIRHRLLEVSSLIKGSLVTSLAMLLIIVLYIIFWQGYIAYLPERTSALDLVVNVLYLGFACGIYSLLQSKIQQIQQRMYSRNWYDYTAVRQKLFSITETQLEPEQLFSGLQLLLQTQMQFPTVHFFVEEKLFSDSPSPSKWYGWSSSTQRLDALAEQDLRLDCTTQPWPSGTYTLYEEAAPALQELMRQFNSAAALPFYLEGNLTGLALIAARSVAPQFNHADLLIFDLLVSKVELCFSRIIKHLHIKRLLLSFAGSIAHEIRNPLAQIYYCLQSINGVLPSPGFPNRGLSAPKLEQLYQHLSVGQRAVDRGQQVIDMVLAEVKASTTDRGVADVSRLPFLSAAQIARQAISEYAYNSAQEQARVHLEVVRDFQFQGDEIACLFVLFNLLKNALYYFAQYPQATLTLTVNTPTITVTDTGPGISPAQLPYIFTPFQSQKLGGTGLGLAYCQRVLRNLGGEIRCESVLNSYTRFTLDFSEVITNSVDPQTTLLRQQAEEVLQGRWLLLVESDPAQRARIQHLLDGFNLHWVLAQNAEQALQKLPSYQIDALLIDLTLCLSDDCPLTAQMRTLPGYASLPIIAYSSQPRPVSQTKIQRAQINTWLSTLERPHELWRTLVQTLQQHHFNTASFPGKKVLLVDDNEYNRRQIRQQLESFGLTVFEATEGDGGLTQLAQHPDIDLLLIDLSMPGKDGFTTAQEIRRMDWAYQKLPIVALTAYNDEIHKHAALAVGINEFLLKPASIQNLRKILQRFLTPATSASQDVSFNDTAGLIQSDPAMAQANGIPGLPPQIAALPLLNARRLAEFQQIGLVDDMSDYLTERATQYLQTIQQSAADNNQDQLRDAIHGFLGMNGYAGTHALLEYLRDLLNQVTLGKPLEPENWLTLLETLNQVSLSALKNYCANFNRKLMGE